MSDTAASEHNEQEHNTMISDWTVDLIAGWTSGAAAVVACQPVDTILTRWQAATTTASYPVVATATSTSTSTAVGSVGIPMGHGNGSVPGWRSLTVNLYRTAGWTALWRGASPMITAVPLQNALLMSGYGMGQRFYAGSDGVDASTAQQPLSRSKQLGAIFVGGCTGGECIFGVLTFIFSVWKGRLLDEESR